MAVPVLRMATPVPDKKTTLPGVASFPGCGRDEILALPTGKLVYNMLTDNALENGRKWENIHASI